MKIKLPKKVNYIIQKLNNAGHEAYAVGGCIRDSILGRIPGDWDITTSAQPDQVKEIFEKTIDTGILHGTVTVLLQHEGFEVTTYRIDGEYKDARHPDYVVFTGNLIEDLKRRDFTINAMAYNEEAGLIDVFGGIADINMKRVKCVGDPSERFQEDALRMLRAIRFAAQLDFMLEERTIQAIQKLSANLSRVSAERIQAELIKLIISDHPERLYLIYMTGLSKAFFPELDLFINVAQNKKLCFFDHLALVPGQKSLRLAMLLHDIAFRADSHRHGQECAQIAQKILRRLRFDNDTIARVYKLILWHEDKPLLIPRRIREAIHRIGKECYPELFILQRGIAKSLSKEVAGRECDYINSYEKIYEKILENKDCLERKDLAVTGKDLIDAGVAQGKELGVILDRMLALVLEYPEYNKKETLLEKCLE